MKKINKNKIKIKNLIGIVDNPIHEDLLFEIVSFLEDENRDDFKKWDVAVKTRCRIESSIEKDLQVLINRGYIKHQKYTMYKLIRHPWEN